MTEGAIPIEEARRRQRERRFPLQAFGDIRVSTSRNALVKGLIPIEGLTVIWGAPKCGKTFLTFDLSLHVALGWEYRGRRVVQGTVVYIACEGERGLAARTEAFRRAKMTENIDHVPFYLLTTRLDLAADIDQLITDICAQLEGQPCSLIVVDTLNRALAGSENSDEDMGGFIRAIDAIREQFACAVAVIHHCGVNGSRPRGHTSLMGAADAQIAVKRDNSNVIVATVEFMKDGEAGAEIASKLEVVDVGQDEDGETITSCVVEPVERAAPEASDQPRRIPSGARTALDLLRKAIAEAGEIPPCSPHIPADTHAVNEELWRRYCYAGDISDGDTTDAKSKAFRRAAKALLNAKAVGKWAEWIWICA